MLHALGLEVLFKVFGALVRFAPVRVQAQGAVSAVDRLEQRGALAAHGGHQREPVRQGKAGGQNGQIDQKRSKVFVGLALVFQNELKIAADPGGKRARDQERRRHS